MPSINAPTFAQIKLACRRVIEMREAGITENIAIRQLELLANLWGKFRLLSHCSPDRADQFEYWSRAARKAKVTHPNAAYGTYLRVEHGTPRRDFAREVLAAYKAGKLTAQWMDRHCTAKYKIAIVTQRTAPWWSTRRATKSSRCNSVRNYRSAGSRSRSQSCASGALEARLSSTSTSRRSRMRTGSRAIPMNRVRVKRETGADAAARLIWIKEGKGKRGLL
jgi:hypothetical protein